MHRNDGTKVAIVSDTHLPRFRSRVPVALERVAAESPDAILHCGDVTDLAELDRFAAIAPLDAVAGNNDGPEIERRFGRRKIVEIAGVRIGMVHGDGARGTTLSRALGAFADDAVDVVAFGHSHVPYLARHADRWIVNPGSPTDKRRERQFSFAMLECADGVVRSARLVRFG